MAALAIFFALASPSDGIPARVTDVALTPAFVAEQLYHDGQYWEPTIVADPSSNYVYMAGTHLLQWRITLRVSDDGGATWGPAIQPPCGCPWQADPVLAVSDSGVVYLAYINGFSPGASLMKSFDHGTTWTAPVTVETTPSPENDKPWMVVSPSGTDVYITYNNDERCCSLAHQFVSVSHDGGASFGSPIRTSGKLTWSWYVWGGAMAPNGTVYFAESALNKHRGSRGKAFLVSSSDDGVTWTRTMLGSSFGPPDGSAHSVPDASVAVDSAGTTMFASTSASTQGGDKVLSVRTSANGVTWSAPKVVSQQGDAGYEVLAAGSAPGDFRLVWMDDRAGGAFSWNTRFARTTDGGATWTSPVRLSNVGTGGPYKAASGFRHPGGDYLGMAVNQAGGNVIAWGESMNYATNSYVGGVWFTTGG